MNRSYSEVYVHLIWSTWDRLDLIDQEIEQALYTYICKKSNQNNFQILTIGGTSDHIHLLVRLNTAISIGEMVRLLKGSSSHYIANVFRPEDFFRWQGGYAVFSVSPFHVKTISQYILNQKRHHSADTWEEKWEIQSYGAGQKENCRNLFYPTIEIVGCNAEVPLRGLHCILSRYRYLARHGTAVGRFALTSPRLQPLE